MRKTILFVSALSILGCAERTPTDEKWSCSIQRIEGETVIDIDYKNQSARISGDTVAKAFKEMIIPISHTPDSVSLLFGEDGQIDLEKMSSDRAVFMTREDASGPMTRAGTCDLKQ